MSWTWVDLRGQIAAVRSGAVGISVMAGADLFWLRRDDLRFVRYSELGESVHLRRSINFDALEVSGDVAAELVGHAERVYSAACG